MRDERRAAVYAAEQQLRDLLEWAAGSSIDFFGSTLTLPLERKFTDFGPVSEYLASVLRHSKWAELSVPSLRPRQGELQAHYEIDAQCIALPSAGGWAWRETVLLHELAHHVVALRLPDAAGHGPEFVAVLLALIEQELGAASTLVLRAAFDGVGLQVGVLP